MHRNENGICIKIGAKYNPDEWLPMPAASRMIKPQMLSSSILEMNLRDFHEQVPEMMSGSEFYGPPFLYYQALNRIFLRFWNEFLEF